MAVIKDETKYAVIDPWERTKVHHTETQGDLPVGSTGYVILRNKETVAEIKERMPYAVVSEMGGLRPSTRAFFTVPELPWKRQENNKG